MRIGELADLVGISTRAIRHYHRVGLLPEPARRGNGYRDYSLRDAVGLARVRRLVELGLSLAEVGDVLAGDADRDLAEILRELDADLAGQEADIRRRRARLAQLLRQTDQGMPAEQAPVSPGLATLFSNMAEAAAGHPGPEPAMAAKDREVMALLETVSGAHGADWLDKLAEGMADDPGAIEQAHAVYALLDDLAGSPADDPRVETAARQILASIPESARQAIRIPDGAFEEAGEGFAAAFYADFAPAQAAAIRLALKLMQQSNSADSPENEQETAP
ncbi:MerR family transcriptional regulator [Actinoplanes sp. NPDC026619]|uniref:helix-turn-helix domain-containing protein n=1 Tax=Actinoplanes sp. NPDC026619 TaxID=3155798 RepID=UPI0033CEF6D8